MPVIRGDFRASLPVVSRARGIWVWDTDGRQYLDGSSGAVTVNIGHGVPAVLEAMRRQSEQVCFVHRGQFGNGPAAELADAIAAHAPGDLNWCFFTNSGSEANELAHKFAIQYWRERGLPGKTWVLSRWNSYHGSTLGALSMSGHIARRKWFAGLALAFPAVPAPYSYSAPAAPDATAYDLAAADALETAILRAGPENVAAFIAEPVVGASGAALTPPPGYYERVRAICDRYDVLFIADEVMTGFGRTGRWFASEHWQALPDIITFGKGVSSGYTPLAGMVIREARLCTILDGSGRFGSGHTFGGNPLSAATALAVLRYAEAQGLVENARAQGEYLRQGLSALAGVQPLIGDVRGLGLMQGLELVADRATREPFPAAANVVPLLAAVCREEGLLFYPCQGLRDGSRGDGLLLAPPLCIDRAGIDELLARLGRALGRLASDLKAAGDWHG